MVKILLNLLIYMQCRWLIILYNLYIIRCLTINCLHLINNTCLSTNPSICHMIILSIYLWVWLSIYLPVKVFGLKTAQNTEHFAAACTNPKSSLDRLPHPLGTVAGPSLIPHSETSSRYWLAHIIITTQQVRVKSSYCSNATFSNPRFMYPVSYIK